MVNEIRLISPDNDCEVLRCAWHPCEQMQLHMFDWPVRGNRNAISVKKKKKALSFQLKFILMTLSGCICPLHSISIWFNLNKSHLSQESKECLARHMGEQIFGVNRSNKGNVPEGTLFVSITALRLCRGHVFFKQCLNLVTVAVYGPAQRQTSRGWIRKYASCYQVLIITTSR